MRPAHSFFGSGSILENPSQSCDAPFGYISVSSSVECARPTPSSEADLFSKIRRKVVTCCLGVYPFPHQPSAPGTLLRRKLICSRKSVAKLCVSFGCISVPSSVECARPTPSSETDLSSKIHRKVVRADWVVPARVRTTGLLLHYSTSPASAGLGCSFSDGCDTSPTETLRNFHLTGSLYLLQFADGSLDI